MLHCRISYKLCSRSLHIPTNILLEKSASNWTNMNLEENVKWSRNLVQRDMLWPWPFFFINLLRGNCLTFNPIYSLRKVRAMKGKGNEIHLLPTRDLGLTDVHNQTDLFSLPSAYADEQTDTLLSIELFWYSISNP